MVDQFDESARLAGIEAPGFAKGLVEQEEGSEHAVIGKHAAVEDHAVAAPETIEPDHDVLALLKVVLDIDGMVEPLGVVAGDGREGVDRDPIGGVNAVELGDS